MPYREKTAWLSLFAMAVTFGPYFTYVATHSVGNRLPNLRQLGLYAVVIVVQLIVLGIGHLLLRNASPQEWRIPPDERDRAISSRSVSSAYYVLLFGMIYVGCILPFSARGWTIVNNAIFTIVIAEVARGGVAIYSYRRQA